MQGTLIIPVGMPGCGKSTWANATFPDAVIVSSDDIRREMGDGTLLGFWAKSAHRQGQVFKTFHERIEKALEQKKTVVADATNLTPKARYSLYEIGRAKEAQIHLTLFVNVREAVERNKLRVDARVPNESMGRMLDQFSMAYPDILDERGEGLIDSYARIDSWNETVTHTST